jgi:hypothetical protein
MHEVVPVPQRLTSNLLDIYTPYNFDVFWLDSLKFGIIVMRYYSLGGDILVLLFLLMDKNILAFFGEGPTYIC